MDGESYHPFVGLLTPSKYFSGDNLRPVSYLGPQTAPLVKTADDAKLNTTHIIGKSGPNYTPRYYIHPRFNTI